MPLPPRGQRERFAWAPDNAAITFRNNLAGVGNLWNLPIDGGAPTPITHFDSPEIHSFSWLPDGRLAIARAQPAADVVLIRGFNR